MASKNKIASSLGFEGQGLHVFQQYSKYLLKADSILFRKFSIKHVVVVESPKQEEKDLQVKLFASLPDGSDIRKDNQSVILGAALQEILLAHKNNITFVVGAEIKSINMDSDSESEENSTDNKMNYIMIPISFSMLIVLCFVACCLHCAR